MTRGARMLVVDDEPQILRSLRTALTAAGYDIQTAATGEEALRLLQGRLPDLVILDLVLPGISGLEVCRRLREHSSVPILVLSARGEERDKVAALDLGADDYLTKAFGVEELLARIRAALRRAAGLRGPSMVIEAGDLRVDVDRRLVTHTGVEVHLTATQFNLLKTLVVHAGRVLTHAYLLRTVWGPEYEGETQVLRVFIAQLRRKVEPDPAQRADLTNTASVSGNGSDANPNNNSDTLTTPVSAQADLALTISHAPEPVLRECLTTREKAEPDARTTFDTRSMLGGALLGQRKYADAEPLLLAGYDGMKRREKQPPPDTARSLPDAADRLVELYAALGNSAESAKWRAERAKYPREQAPRPRAVR